MIESLIENFFWFFVTPKLEGFNIKVAILKKISIQFKGLASIVSSIDVSQEGVGGAKGFFENKISALNDSTYEKDKAYHEQKKKELEEKRKARAEFKEKANLFQ